MGLIADVVRDVFETAATTKPEPRSRKDPTLARTDHVVQTVLRTMRSGAVPIWPVRWNQVLQCARCGPVYWAEAGKVDGCPWCWQRHHGIPVPEIDRGG